MNRIRTHTINSDFNKHFPSSCLSIRLLFNNLISRYGLFSVQPNRFTYRTNFIIFKMLTVNRLTFKRPWINTFQSNVLHWCLVLLVNAIPCRDAEMKSGRASYLEKVTFQFFSQNCFQCFQSITILNLEIRKLCCFRSNWKISFREWNETEQSQNFNLY